MDSLHATQISRPRLRGKDFTGSMITARARAYRDISARRLLPSPSSQNQTALSNDIEIPYSHLDSSWIPPLQHPDAIRLVRVLPSLKEGSPQCYITTHSITQSFTALSYTWGDPGSHGTTWLNDVEYKVRHNLWQFLLLASRELHDSLIWIDALCIDQNNRTEKSQQVGRMGDIYQASSKTLTFLAEEHHIARSSMIATCEVGKKLRDLDSDLRKCLQILQMKTIDRQSTNSGDLLADTSNDVSVVEVLKFLSGIVSHSYWTRLWVIQEITLTRARNSIVFGNAKVSFTVFVQLVSYICGTYNESTLEQQISGLSQEIMFKTPDMWLLEILECTTDPVRRGLTTDDFFPSAVVARPELDKENFLHLMARVQTTLCSDRRDKLYGLRAFQNSGEKFAVNYDEDIYNLYFRACRYFEDLVDTSRDDAAQQWIGIIQKLSASLDLSLVDLVLGDKSGRTMLETAPRLVAASDTGRELMYLDDSHDAPIRCQHCQKTVRFKERPVAKRCILQCHRQLESHDRDFYDHFLVRSYPDGAACSVEAATSQTEPGVLSTTPEVLSKSIADRLSIDDLLYLILMDELYRHRAYARRLPEHIPRDRRKVVLHPDISEILASRMKYGKMFTALDVEDLGLEHSAEDCLLSFLNTQLSTFDVHEVREVREVRKRSLGMYLQMRLQSNRQDRIRKIRSTPVSKMQWFAVPLSTGEMVGSLSEDELIPWDGPDYPLSREFWTRNSGLSHFLSEY